MVIKGRKAAFCVSVHLSIIHPVMGLTTRLPIHLGLPYTLSHLRLLLLPTHPAIHPSIHPLIHLPIHPFHHLSTLLLHHSTICFPTQAFDMLIT